MDIKSCCITGHREIPKDKMETVRDGLEEAVRRCVGDGYKLFMSGMEDGAEVMFAEAVSKVRLAHPHIELEAVVPYPERLTQGDGYHERIHKLCNVVHPVCREQTEDSYFLRNRYMLHQCDRVITVYDRREDGITAAFVAYARTMEKEIVEIPM